MVFNVTFNNITVISWRSVLLMEETKVPGENNWPVASQWQTSYNVVSSTPRLDGIQTHNVNGDRHRLHKSNYPTITTTMASICIWQFYLLVDIKEWIIIITLILPVPAPNQCLLIYLSSCVKTLNQIEVLHVFMLLVELWTIIYFYTCIYDLKKFLQEGESETRATQSVVYPLA